MRSGELSRRTGLSSDTLRHYERKGVLPKPVRTASGYRVYDTTAVARVEMIQRALAVGFSLDELARVFAVRERGGAPCRQVRNLAAEKLRELEQRLRDMHALRDDLRRMLADWDARLEKHADSRAHLLEALPASRRRIPSYNAPGGRKK